MLHKEKWRRQLDITINPNWPSKPSLARRFHGEYKSEAISAQKCYWKRSDEETVKPAFLTSRVTTIHDGLAERAVYLSCLFLYLLLCVFWDCYIISSSASLLGALELAWSGSTLGRHSCRLLKVWPGLKRAAMTLCSKMATFFATPTSRL